MEVVDAIAAVDTHAEPPSLPSEAPVPDEDAVILSARLRR
jgi:hypothetical protein